MKKGQVFECMVERVEFPNRGIIPIEDRKVVVKNTLPGQKISFCVQKLKKGKAEGRLLEVLERAPEEIDSPCPHFGECGGCTYQNYPYEAQLRLKEGQVRGLLDGLYEKRNENARESYLFEGIQASPQQYEYRNKMEFSFGDAYLDGPLALGMHKRGSFYDIVTVDDCRIVDGDYRIILKTVLDYFQELGAKFYHKIRHQGYLRHLLLRKGQHTGEILVALITTSQESMELTGLVEKLLGLEREGRLKGTIVGILHTKNDSLADVVKSDETAVLYGRDYFYEKLLGMKFKISQFSFFQTNSLGAEVLYETVRDYVGCLDEDGKRDKVVFDLYSGTGTIAQMLSPVAAKVVGVEIVEEAVEAARENAALNGLFNIEFIAGDVLKVLDGIMEKPDIIVLDPPRDGIHPKALGKIIDYGVEKIVYVSCKPTSLVRDLEVFLERGYRVVRGGAVDMFSGTVHVETVALLTRKAQ